MPVPLGFHHSAEAKARMSLAHIGVKRPGPSLETRRKISQSLTGLHPNRNTRIKMRIAKLNWTFSIDHRAKISAACMGRSISEESRIKIGNANRGRHPSKETRGKLRAALLGEKSPYWRGGMSIRYSPEFNNDLRETIRKRDDYLCQNPKCYVPENGNHHDCHHVDYNRQNNNLSNLITLCHSCHARTINGNRDYWVDFYRGLQEMRAITGTMS